jgi:uridylate kinase
MNNSIPSANGRLRYQRILLKLSGEAMQGAGKYGIDQSTVDSIARQVVSVARRGVQVGIVSGARRRPGAAWTARRPITWGCSRR